MKLHQNNTRTNFPFLNFLLLLGFVSFFLSCESETTTIDDLRTVCFDTEIFPLIQNSCSSVDCHGAAAKDGYRFESYEGIMAAVRPGDASKSELYRVLTARGEDHMPPEQTLSMEARMLIRVWIEQGAEEIICRFTDSNIVIIDTTEAWTNPYVCFERDIMPLMASSCGTTGCHDAASHVEGYNFTTYAGILEGLTPGNPASSEIYEAITEDEPGDIMPPPPHAPLTQAQIDSIYQWILRGALDEDCGSGCDTSNVTYSTHLAQIISVSCTGCHSGSSPQGGVKLENYNDLVAAVNSGAVPAVLTASNGYSLMPPAAPLSDCNIALLNKWIENGLPE